MSLLADALQPHISPGLFSVRGKVDATLDDLIGRKGGFYSSYDGATSIWTFNFVASDPVASFFANECSRFASASFQTFSSVPHDLQSPEKLPWALVQAYYAAFYAGHSILRILGSSCTYVDGTRLSLLKRVLALQQTTPAFPGGHYETTIDGNGSEVSFKLLGTNLGGTHEQFWHVFNKQISQLEQKILGGTTLPPIDAQQAWACLGQFRSVITKSTASASWLSNVRNTVQYRHSHGVWFPGKLVRRDRLILSRIANRWLSDPLSIPLAANGCGELGPFIASCTFLVSFCRSLITRLAERGKRGHAESFVHYGPQRYLNMISA